MKKYSENKNKENNNEIKSRHNKPSEFSIFENKLFNNSNQSNSDSSESSENSDFEEDF